MNKLVIFIIILITIIYINYYKKFNKNFEIIQLSSEKLNNDILHEKLPILLEDPISSPNDFINVLFTYEYIFKKKIDYKVNKYSPLVNQNLAYYTIIYNNNDDDIPIYISNPKFSNKFKFSKNNSFYYRISNYIVEDEDNINDVQFLKINLKSKHLIILPSYWLFYLNNDCEMYFLYGFYNLIISFSKICL